MAASRLTKSHQRKFPFPEFLFCFVNKFAFELNFQFSSTALFFYLKAGSVGTNERVKVEQLSLLHGWARSGSNK